MKTPTFSETEAAAMLSCSIKSMRSRLVALGCTKVCGRCGGSGKYSFNAMTGDRCFGCQGAGKVLLPITRSLIEKAVERIAAGELAAYFAHIEAVRAARAAIAPLFAEVVTLYQPIGDAYMVASRAARDADDTAAFVQGFHFKAQGLANAIRWGHHEGKQGGAGTLGAERLMSDAGRKFGALAVVREMAERVEMMRALRAVFDAAQVS